MPTTQDGLDGDRFVTDELERRAAEVVARLPAIWKRDGHIKASVLMWPYEPVTDQEGQEYDPVLAVGELPENTAEWSEYLRGAMTITHAYAILLIETKRDQVLAIFESHLGTRAWSRPIERHGDARVLGTVTETRNQECLGLLWHRGGPAVS